MAEMTFAEFVALKPSPAKFIQPVADNIRKRIVERMAAALEFAEYGAAGAGGGAVLPKFKADYGSEVGIYSTNWPLLMTVPIETTSFTEDFIGQEHQIHVQADVVGEDGETVTRNVQIYLRAIVIIILSLKMEDIVGGIDSVPGACQWDVINHNYDALRQKKGLSIYKRSASVRVQVKLVEKL